MNPAAHVLMCIGVLLLAIQWENWRKPDVVHRIVEAAQPVVKQRMVHIVEIRPEGPPIEYLEPETEKPPVFR